MSSIASQPNEGQQPGPSVMLRKSTSVRERFSLARQDSNNFIRGVVVRAKSTSSSQRYHERRPSSTYETTQFSERARKDKHISKPRYVSRFIEHMDDSEDDEGGAAAMSNEEFEIVNASSGTSSPPGSSSRSTILSRNSGGKTSSMGSRRSEVLRKAANKLSKLFK